MIEIEFGENKTGIDEKIEFLQQQVKCNVTVDKKENKIEKKLDTESYQKFKFWKLQITKSISNSG